METRLTVAVRSLAWTPFRQHTRMGEFGHWRIAHARWAASGGRMDDHGRYGTTGLTDQVEAASCQGMAPYRTSYGTKFSCARNPPSDVDDAESSNPAARWSFFIYQDTIPIRSCPVVSCPVRSIDAAMQHYYHTSFPATDHSGAEGSGGGERTEDEQIGHPPPASFPEQVVCACPEVLPFLFVPFCCW